MLWYLSSSLSLSLLLLLLLLQLWLLLLVTALAHPMAVTTGLDYSKREFWAFPDVFLAWTFPPLHWPRITGHLHGPPLKGGIFSICISKAQYVDLPIAHFKWVIFRGVFPLPQTALSLRLMEKTVREKITLSDVPGSHGGLPSSTKAPGNVRPPCGILVVTVFFVTYFWDSVSCKKHVNKWSSS